MSVRAAPVVAARWRAAAALLLALLVLLPQLAPAQGRPAAEVFGVRFGVNQNVTRVVLDVDAATRYATRVLTSPPRLVIELDNVRWQVRSHPQGDPVGLARTVTVAALDAGRGRLVIDIDRPFRILRQDWLPPSGDAAHHRLVIDLAAAEPGPPAPAAPPAPTVAEAARPAPPPAAAPAGPAAGSERRAPPAVAARVPRPIAGPPQPRPALPDPPPTLAAVASGDAPPDPVAPDPVAPDPAPADAVDGEPVDGDAATAVAMAALPLPGAAEHHLPPLPADEPDAAPAMVDADAGATLVGVPVRPAPPPPARRKIIAIDPGHGGADPGTVGINGVLEKEVTLDVAQRLRRLIEATGRYDVVLTREDDVFVSLRERMETARRADASLFISVHADSLGDSRFRGASVYTLSDQASDAEAARLATKENRADIIAGTDLSAHDEIVAGILIDLAQRVTNNKSIEFADVLTRELAEVTALVRNTRRFAGFVVLKSPDVPSVLLELGYLSNPTDAANLARPEYRDQLARATLRAIDRYFAEQAAAL